MECCFRNDCIEVGLDEVARGTLIGRVYTAGVIWPDDYVQDTGFIIKDSKKLSKKKEKNYMIILLILQ